MTSNYCWSVKCLHFNLRTWSCLQAWRGTGTMNVLLAAVSQAALGNTSHPLSWIIFVSTTGKVVQSGAQMSDAEMGD